MVLGTRETWTGKDGRDLRRCISGIVGYGRSVPTKSPENGGNESGEIKERSS